MLLKVTKGFTETCVCLLWNNITIESSCHGSGR